jgi:uncharacterized protein
MTHRLSVPWPDPAPFAGREGRPIRLLAVSDIVDPALAAPENRANIGQLDLIAGCGDLEPDYLAMLADAFCVRLVYIRGNHDRGRGWDAASHLLPRGLKAGHVEIVEGLPVAGFDWPGIGDREDPRPRDGLAWRQAAHLRLALSIRGIRHGGRHVTPLLLSHSPPRGLGDVPSDAYHRGFAGYRWLVDAIGPPLWLHGHTPTASARDWRVVDGPTTVVNVTGAVVVELSPQSSGATLTA